MRPRVCIVRQRDHYELPVRREAEALRDAGFAVDVLCLRGDGEPLVADDAGVRLYRVPLRRRKGGTLGYLIDYGLFFACAAVVLTVLHVVRRYRAIQVNSMPDFLVFATAVPRLLGARVLLFCKEPMPELALTRGGSARQYRVLARVEQAALRYCDLAFTVTEQLARRYAERGADGAKIVVVLNGPDARHLRPDEEVSRPDPRHVTVICHGSIEERYGHEDILRALTIAREQVPELRLVVTGTGDDAERIRALVGELGLDDAVDWRGWVSMDELVATLHASDAGVVAQRSSPYSNLVHTNKMFEYFLLGKPAVLSRLDAVRAYVDEDTAAFFTPGDPASLAAVLVRLATDRQWAHQLGEAGRRRYAELGWERQREVYLAGYGALGLAGYVPAGGRRAASRRAPGATPSQRRARSTSSA